MELSLIFQELRTQDTLRKFENGSPEAFNKEMNVNETFADLLDRAANLSGGLGINEFPVKKQFGKAFRRDMRGGRRCIFVEYDDISYIYRVHIYTCIREQIWLIGI